MKSKKTRVHECKHFQFDYDDLGKYCYCNLSASSVSLCNFEYVYCMQFCPNFQKGKLRGTWHITEAEKAEAEKVKAQHKND